MRFVYISGIFLGVSVGGWVYRGFFFLIPLISYRVLIVFSLIGGDSRQDKGIPFLVSRGGGMCDDTASVDCGRTKGRGV